MNTMEPIEHKGETKFYYVTDMNSEQEGEVLDLDEQVNLNPCSNSLMVSKVTQRFNGAPIPAFIYTNDTVRAICAKSFLPEPIHVSFLNKYDCMLEFPTGFKLHKIALDLEQIMQWFSYGVRMTCEVVTKDKLIEIEQSREEPNPSPSLDVTGKNFETPTASSTH